MRRSFFTLFFLLLAQSAWAARDFWVSPSGTSKTCTDTTTPQTAGALPTINAGMACLTAAGDTLHIRGGIYNESVNYGNFSSLANGTSYTNPVKVMGHTGETVEIHPTSSFAFGAVLAMGTTTVQYHIVENVIIDGSDIAQNGASNVSIGAGATNVRFVNVTSRNNTKNRPDIQPGAGVIVGGDHIEWIGGASLDNGATSNPYNFADDLAAPYGFYWSATNGLIDGTTISGNGAYGVHNYHSGGNPFGMTVRNSTIFNNGNHYYSTVGSPPNKQSAGILFAGSGGAAYNNVIRDNLPNQVGIDVNGNGDGGTVIYGNTIIRNLVGIQLTPSNSVAAKNNIVSANGTNFPVAPNGSNYASNLCSSAGGTQLACALGEPITSTFVNSTSDYHLKPGSVAIDNGTNLGGAPYNTDKDGNPRGAGGAWDIGAYESGVTTPTMTVSITAPANNSTTNAAGLTISGSVANGGTLSSMTWSCDRCGSGTGTITGPTTWTATGITLKAGVNVVTATVNGTNGTASAMLTITYAPTFPGNALVGAWGFEENTGATTADSSGNNNNGVLSGATWTTNGKYGNALSFNGTSNFVSINDSNSLDFTQSFTLSAWVLPTAIDSTFRAIVSKNPTLQNLYATEDGTFCAGGGIFGSTRINGTDYRSVCSAAVSPLQVNVWTHLAVTYDTTAAALKLYRNGALIASAPVSGYMEPSTMSLLIGSSQFNEFFAGRTDEVRAYNFAIPVTAGSNTSPGATCGDTNYTTTVVKTPALASVVGDMNCAVIPANITPPLPIKFPASATGLKVGSSATGLKFGSK